MTWDTDNKRQDEEEPTIAAEKITDISDKAVLLSDSSNSNFEDSDNDVCTLTTTNQSRTASAYSVIGKDGTERKQLPFSNAERVEGRNVFTWSSG